MRIAPLRPLWRILRSNGFLNAVQYPSARVSHFAESPQIYLEIAMILLSEPLRFRRLKGEYRALPRHSMYSRVCLAQRSSRHFQKRMRAILAVAASMVVFGSFRLNGEPARR